MVEFESFKSWPNRTVMTQPSGCPALTFVDQTLASLHTWEKLGFERWVQGSFSWPWNVLWGVPRNWSGQWTRLLS